MSREGREAPGHARRWDLRVPTAVAAGSLVALVVLWTNGAKYALFVTGAAAVTWLATPFVVRLAYRLGAVESVVSREALLPTAMELALKIAAKSSKALRLAKEALNGIELIDVKKSYRFEQGFTLELYTSPDSQESRDAFVEKRDAAFEGRPKKK